MHHTKFKADVAVAKVIADLMIKGYIPCIPLSEHQPFDLIGVNAKGDTKKFQVKYAALKNNGTVEVRFRTSWSDKNGVHTKHYLESDFDYYAIYCADKEVVLYVPNLLHCPKSVRFGKPANNQKKSVHWAADYMWLERESSETIRRTPEMAKT